MGRFSGAPDRLEILPERYGYFMTDIGYLRTKKSVNGQIGATLVKFGRMNAVEAGLGRFSGALNRLQVLPDRSGYFMSDIGYLRTKISDNGQKCRNELFGSILVA